MKVQFGLNLREEIHAGAMLTRPGDLVRIKRHDRLAILREATDELATMADLNVINVVVDKQGKPANYDVFGMAWKCLIQRFENTLSHRNFRGPANADERGMIFPDHTDDKKLTQLLRQMRRWNPTPHQGGGAYRNLPLQTIIEDPNFRESHRSLFVQSADLAAWLLYQSLAPSVYVKKKSAHNYFSRLDPVLCKMAAPRDPQGVVRL